MSKPAVFYFEICDTDDYYNNVDDPKYYFYAFNVTTEGAQKCMDFNKVTM
jgi:hypothetical protein